MSHKSQTYERLTARIAELDSVLVFLGPCVTDTAIKPEYRSAARVMREYFKRARMALVVAANWRRDHPIPPKLEQTPKPDPK